MLELRPDNTWFDHLPASVRGRSHASRQLESVLTERRVRSVYQPLVELYTERVVGYEALARGPEGSALERPDALFGAAATEGRVADLCEACRISAVRGATEAELVSPFALFVNVEPDGLDRPFPDLPPAPAAGGAPGIVVEVTERALAADPAGVLRGVERLRAQGLGIALDDVGADRHSLALMPFLRPDVIKLDLGLVQSRPSAEVAEIVNAVNAEAERTGAAVVAEGIETERHLETAIAMGAHLGQGWLFGRPGPLPADLPEPGAEVRRVAAPRAIPRDTPVSLVGESKPLRRATKRHLMSTSRHLEQQAGSLGEATVLLSGFQRRERFTEATRDRYAAIAENAAFVGVFGTGMGAAPAPGVRGADLDHDDPLVDEWDIAVVAPHFAALLAARDLGDEGPEADRRFDFVITYDRELVLMAASALMARVSPATEPVLAPA